MAFKMLATPKNSREKFPNKLWQAPDYGLSFLRLSGQAASTV